MFSWVGNLTHLYLTSLCGAVNYHIPNFDQSLEHRGADRDVLRISEWNVANCFGEDAKINFDLAGSQGVKRAVASQMAYDGMKKGEQRNSQRNSQWKTKVAKDRNGQERKNCRDAVRFANRIKRRAEAKDDCFLGVNLVGALILGGDGLLCRKRNIDGGAARFF